MGALGVASQVISAGAAGVDTVRKLAPQLEDEVVVEVTGQPGHEKQQLYFLALAAANGEVKRWSSFTNGVVPTYGLLMIEFDQASNWVRVTLRYKVSTLLANANPRNFFNSLAIYRGPACEVVGRNFDFVDPNIGGVGGVPKSSLSPDSPNGAAGLPFNLQTILTPCPTVTPPVQGPITQNPAPTPPKNNNGTPISSPNPKPPGDNRSRGAVVVTGQGLPNSGAVGAQNGSGPCCPKSLALIPLVFASLSAPATDAKMRYVTPPVDPSQIG